MFELNYIELQYIEANNTQYLNTNFIPSSTSKIELDILSKNNMIRWAFGSRSEYGSNDNWSFLFVTDDSIRIDYSDSVGVSIPNNNNNRMTITLDKGKYYINNNLLYVNTDVFNANYPLYIGDINSGGNSSGTAQRFMGYIYACKIWDNDTLIRDYIPAKRKNDSKIGLYDKINDEFIISLASDYISGPEKKPSINNETIDWSKSMKQTFEYYEVDPTTWMDKKLISNIKSCTIDRNSDSSSKGSASIEIDNVLGEAYIRIYLISTQGSIVEKTPLGIYLVQTPRSSFDGKITSVSMDAYTPLLELAENPVPLGYAILKNSNILENVYMIARDNCRAPVIKTTSDKTLEYNFIANVNDTWLSYITDLLNIAQYKINLDNRGQIIFEPDIKMDEIQPIWTFNDDNSSILLPNLSITHDLYKIPNVVEVTASVGNEIYTAIIKNEDPNSVTSTINRNREITVRVTDPQLPGIPTKEQLDDYAKTLLIELSSLEYEISFSHGYCPVRVGDCVRLNYKSAKLQDVKAKIISQSIKCSTGCTISTRAIFTKKLWE